MRSLKIPFYKNYVYQVLKLNGGSVNILQLSPLALQELLPISSPDKGGRLGMKMATITGRKNLAKPCANQNK